MKRFVLAWLALVALLLAGSPPAHSQAIVPTAQIPLFNGTSLSGLYPWFSTSGFSDPNGVFAVENGMLHVSGNGWGALTTNNQYRDYVMVLEFKWGPQTWGPRQGLAKDSGLLFHSQGAEGGWNGLLIPSIQAQIIEGGIGEVILLKGAAAMSITSQVEQLASGIAPPNWAYRGGYRWKAGNSPVTFNQDVDSVHWSGWDPSWEDILGYRGQTVIESPDGQWNQMVVIANNDTYEIYLNGTKVNAASNVVPSEGKIQLEVEYAEYFVRRWELWPLGHAVGPIITVDQLPGGITGTAYSQVARAVGASVLTWSIASGSLPPGLAINPSTGQITGTPTASGNFNFTVGVTDAASVQATQPFQIAISASTGALVTNGLVLHLDSTQGVSATGNTVTAWSDVSGNANNVVAVNNPQVGTVQTPSGLPSIHFDGVNDHVQRTSTLNGFPSGNAARTIFMVAKYNSTTWWGGIAYGTNSANQSFGLNVRHPDGVLVLHGNSGGNDLISTTPGTGAGWMIQSGLVTGGAGTLFKDGVQIAQFTHTYATGLTRLVIGAEIGNFGFVGMDVAAVLIYNRALSAGERADVEAYLNGKYFGADTTPPVITVPSDLIVEATGSSGTIVNFTTSAFDNVNGSVATNNTPASGSLFPLGISTVTTTAVDAAGNSASSSFSVTVRDTTPPAITVPANLNVEAPDSNGVIVNFTTSATDLVSGAVSTTNTPVSGSLFPIGTTTVTATAIDAAGNSGSNTFTVTVTFVPPPITPQTLIPLINGNSANLLYTWSASLGIGAVTDRFAVQNGTLHVVGNEGGPIISTDRYRDYVMVLEYKWGLLQWDNANGAAKNSGILLHSRGFEGGHDNRNMPGLEVQMAEGSAGDILLEMGTDELGQPLSMSMAGTVGQVTCTQSTWNCRGGYRWVLNGTPAYFDIIYDTIHWYGWDPDWQDVTGYRGAIDHESPDGQWNQMIVVAQGGHTSVYLNGTKVNEILDTAPSAGKVQLEVEGSEYFIRRWELRPLGSVVGPSIRNDTVPNGTVGLPYQQQIGACAGTGSLEWALSGGTLPPSFALNPLTGELSGSPSQIGTHAFTVTVTDDLGLTASQSYQLEIGSAIPATNGLVLYLDSTQGVTTSGNTVTSWTDQSANANNVVASGNPQVGSVLTPTGLQAIKLDGIDDKLQRTGALTGFPTGNAARTMFVVAKYNSSTGWAGAAFGTGANNQAFGLYIRHPDGKLGLHGWGAGNDLISTTDGIGGGWLVQSGLVNAGTGTLFKDGTQIGQFSHTYNTVLGKFVIGEEIANFGFVGMDVAAVLIYNRALSVSERAELNAWLRSKYIVDTTPPSIAIPADITAEATGSNGAIVNFSTSATDIVNGSVATNNVPPSGSLFPLGTTTVTTTASDAAGNTANRTFTVTVRDTTAPVITVPNPGPLTHEAGTPFVDPGATATDAVAGVVPLTSSTSVNGLVPGAYVLTYNFTDAALNAAAQVTVAVNVVDTTAPIITVPNPGPLTHEAGTPFVDPGATATDAVAGVVPLTSSTSVNGLVPGAYVLTYNFTDAALNAAMQKTITVNVVDTTAPIITVPNPGPLTHEAGTPFVDPGATATDAVAGVVPLTSSTSVNGLVPGAYVLTYNFTDAALNAAMQKTVTVNVVDTVGPVITVPANIIAEATASGGATVSFTTSATDLVSGSVATMNVPASGSLFPLGATTVNVTAMDPSGNNAGASFTVTVRDTTAPVITVPNPGPLTHEAGTPFVDPGATATDAVAGVVPLPSSTTVNGLVPGAYVLTYNFTDAALNAAAQVTVAVNVVDTTAPIITVPNPGPLTHEAGTPFVDPGATATDAVAGVVPLTSSTSVNGLVPGAYVLTYNFTDAALNAAMQKTITVNVVDTTAPIITVPNPGPLTHQGGAPFIDPGATATDAVAGVVPLTSSTSVNGLVPGAYVLTYNFTDAALNAAMQKTVTVNVVDTVGPVITVPANIIAEATGSGGATVSFTTSATDLVSGSVATMNVPASGSLFPLGATTVNVTAMDPSGNNAGASFTVTVRDTTAPIITVPNPGPLTHEAGTPFVDPGATATDAVAGVVPLTSSTSVNGLVPGAYVLTYNFTDAALNAAAQVTVAVNVVDTTAPIITVPNPGPLTHEAGTPFVDPGATATDAVAGVVPLTSSTSVNGLVPGAYVLTYNFTDAALNAAMQKTITVNVVDTTAPIITVPNPGPLTHQAGTPFVDPGATATDVVAGVVGLTSSTSVNGLVPGAYVLTYNFTDAALNAAMQKTVTVNVVDTVGPVITVPANIIAEATASGGATVSFTTSATDLVSGSVATMNVPASGSLFPLGATTVNVTAMDPSGNNAGASFTVTVRDTTAPVITVPNPGPLTHEAGTPFVDPGATATDAVAGVVPLPSSTTVNGLVPGAYVLTYNFTDAALNAAAQVTVAVNVVDTTAPIITVPNPGPLTHEAGTPFVDPGATATDAVAGVVPLTSSTSVNGLVPGAYVLTYNFTDAALNAAMQKTVTVNVVDTTAPIITVPNPGPLTHQGGAPFIDPGATATDAVAGVVPLTSSTSVNGLVPGAYVLTYNFTDAALNAAMQKTVTVNVVDTVGPVITVPANIIAEATGSGGAIVTFSTSATDAVSGVVPTTDVPASGTLFPLGVATVTATAMDATGNSANGTFTVTVRDTTAPVITVLNPGPLSHEAGTPFVDPGATATDAVAGVVPLTSSTVVNGLVPGAYVLTYNFTDAALNAAAQVTVTVNVVDTTTTVPGMISYQGRIAAGGVNFNGAGLFKFALINGAGTMTYWSNDGTGFAGGPPVNAVPVEVVNGLYHLRLGDTSLPNMRFIPATAFGSADVRLRIWFSDGINGWQQLAPEQRIASAGFAMRANSATTIDDGGITESKFASSAVVLGNMNASGQAGVASGGIVLSINENPALEAAGYMKVGTATPNGAWQTLAWQNRDGLMGGLPPAARYFHSAVWTGSRMIVWGGRNDGAYFNDGGLYDPVANTWSAMTAAGAPAARCLHSEVWTGTEMIAWGGVNPAGTPTDVGRYNPTADTWTLGGATGAPTGRIFHAAVWTGTEMIVWGGEDCDGNALNDGGRYNPATDTWSPTSGTNAPSPRRSHSAVWTGTEMIVWGGTAPPDRFGDGKRYNPATDIWSDLAAAGAPAARSHHTAVWTGSKMILWGGHDDSGHFTDLRLYDPAGNSWTTGAAADAPDGRDFHTALWTGTEMIVCGGYGVGGILIDGARYDPAANSWTAVHAAGSVSVRWLHSAVWTGTDVILWGGLGGSDGPLLGDTRFFGLVRTVFIYQRP